MSQLRASTKPAERSHGPRILRRTGAATFEGSARPRQEARASRAHRGSTQSTVTAGSRTATCERDLLETTCCRRLLDPVMRTVPLRVPRDARSPCRPNGREDNTGRTFRDLRASMRLSAAPAAACILDRRRRNLTGDQTVLDAMLAAGARAIMRRASPRALLFLWTMCEVGACSQAAKHPPRTGGLSLRHATYSGWMNRRILGPRCPRTSRSVLIATRHLGIRRQVALHRQARDRAWLISGWLLGASRGWPPTTRASAGR